MAEKPKLEPEDVKSPQEMEEDIQSTPTVTWDPFTVFPKEIYVKIFDMLDNSTDKQNFMNAHVKWYELFKSKRVLFLFEPVFKEVVGRDEEEEDSDSFDEYDYNGVFRKYQEYRLVCHDWDNGIQRYFQLHEYYFKIDDAEDVWAPGSTLTSFTYGSTEDEPKPCNILNLFVSERTNHQLEKFSVTHPPSKNPIFSRSVALMPFDGVSGGDRYRTSVDALLERYGGHIWHCRIEMENKLNPEACICIGKWISLMPGLKTLKFSYEESQYGNNPFSKWDLKEIEDTQVIQSDLNELIFLKSSYLPAIVFNKLIGNIPRVEKIQIKIFEGEQSFLRDFGLKIERENLKEAFLTLKGYDDFKHLESSEPCPILQKLVITLEFETYNERKTHAYPKWPEWRMVFRILEEKFPALEELSLRLPKAVSREDKMATIDHSLEFQLNLPKLKKLWVALPNLCSLDFLQPCKELEECQVVLEHSEWDRRNSRELGRLGREKIGFNMDFRNMWKSNIWEKFPRLYKLEIRAWRESEPDPEYIWFGSIKNFDRYTYEKKGEERKY